MSYQGTFLPASSGHLYLGCFGEVRGRDVWLYLPPFAEEMNLSRAIVARQARAFAERGEAVVCLDYFGTGDSEGEFEQASVDLWLNDISDTLAWIRSQGARSVSLWGLRFGGLLAIDYLLEHAQNYSDAKIERLLLWRPVLDGRLLMKQFFRLKQVSESMKGGDKVNWLEKVRQGETVEVAGYPITPSLLEAISELKVDAAGLADFSAIPGKGWPATVWLEAATERVSALIDKLTPHWPSPGLTLQAVPAPAFWQNPDCYAAPQLLQQTLVLTGNKVRAQNYNLAQGALDVC